MKVCVVGAGIIGVSSALRIKQAHPWLDVTIIADKFTPSNTSDGAVGNLIPFLEGTNEKLLLRWFWETYEHCQNIIYTHADASNMGVSHIIGTYLFKSKKEFPKWCYWMNGFRELSKQEIQQYPVQLSCGFSIQTIFCESAKYIPKISEQFLSLGGKMEKRKINSFLELSSNYDIIVNCTGLNSARLCNDKNVFPVRGQVLRVKAPWIRNYIGIDLDLPDRIAIICPNQDSCVLGVTFQKNDFNTTPSVEDRNWIINETAKIYPSLCNAPVLHDWVGLRPGRDGVRLEKEEIFSASKLKKVILIHNYGHYASGVSLHWGCAGDVVKLIDQHISNNQIKSKI